MQHILTLSRTAVIVRHWFEIDLADASMEHGARIELRELAAHSRRGSESAAQLVAVDRPSWRADLFDRLTDAPGRSGPRTIIRGSWVMSPARGSGMRS